MTASVSYLFRAFCSASGKIHADSGLSVSNPVQVSISCNAGARFIIDGEYGETYTDWRADAFAKAAGIPAMTKEAVA